MSRLVITISLVVVVFTSCITIKDTVVDETNFLGKKENNTSIYNKKGNGSFINPFNLNTDNWGLGNIKRLMLVEFEDLQGYRSVELQVIEKDGEKGGLVILYHADKDSADVYHSPNLELNKKMYDNILNNVEIRPTNIDYSFEEEKGLLKVALNLKDRIGKTILLQIDEQSNEMKPCGLLAPIGGLSEDPEFMTIVFMKHFRFLSQNENHIHLTINGERAELLKLPLKVNGIKGLQTKYSMEPVSVCWNPTISEKLELLKSTNGKYSVDNFEIGITDNHSHPEIKTFSGHQGDNLVRFSFSPPIPDLQNLKDDMGKIGRFSMSVDEVEGIMAGVYGVEKREGKVLLTIKPTKGYSPIPGKAWMKRLTWQAELGLQESGEWQITSHWKKK